MNGDRVNVCVFDVETGRESQWRDRLQSQEPAALNEWVSTFHEDVFRLMVHLTKNREVAEDLTQQTFVKAWRAIRTFDGRSSMRVWLHAIGYHEYVSWRRKQRILAPLDHLLHSTKSESHDTESRILLQDAINELTPEHREVFLLHEIYGHSFEDMAVILRTSVGTLKSRAFYARQKLQNLLEPADFVQAGEPNGV